MYNLENRFIRLVKCERGEATLISLVKFIVFFTIIGLGVDFYRLQAFHSSLQTKLEIIANDALELSIRDEFRRERVSKVVAAEAQLNLYDLLMTELNLDSSLNPRTPSILQRPLVIESIEITEGSYAHNGSRYYNTEYPSIRIKGYTHHKAVLIPFLSESLRYIEVPFNLFIENRRYD